MYCSLNFSARGNFCSGQTSLPVTGSVRGNIILYSCRLNFKITHTLIELFRFIFCYKIFKRKKGIRKAFSPESQPHKIMVVIKIRGWCQKQACCFHEDIRKAFSSPCSQLLQPSFYFHETCGTGRWSLPAYDILMSLNKFLQQP